MHAAPDCAFDDLADTYDAGFTETIVGRALREMVWLRLEQLFRPQQRILELGCGTGHDAVRLASRGVRVVATDCSAQMIRVARRKALIANCEDLIEFRCLPMEAIDSFAEGEKFDGVLSNFGAVNCVRDLQALIADLAGRLDSGAPLLWVVMGRHAPWEWLWYTASGRWRKAWRRLRPGGIEWRGLTVSYPTPGRLRSLLQPYFEVTRIAPLGVALPPSYASAWLDRSPVAAKVLTRLERRAQRSSLLASWSDHFIVEAIRRPRGAVRSDAPAAGA
jgi:SAM-dependent methyltransferase